MWIRSRKKNSGGGGGGTGVSLIVTCDPIFAGQVITCSNGSVTLMETCPNLSPYEVEFQGIPAGTWTITGTADGITYTTTKTITNQTAALVSIPIKSGISYDAAYGNANQYVNSGLLAYIGTCLDVLSGADSYHSSSTDIANLSWGSMTNNVSSGRPLNLFSDKITLSLYSEKKQRITFNKHCYVVYSYAAGDVNNMNSMRAHGNVFNNAMYSTGQFLDLGTHYSSESSFVSIYEIK